MADRRRGHPGSDPGNGGGYSSIVQIYGHLLHVAVYGAAAALVSWKLALGAACVAAVVITAFSGLVRMARRDAEHATVLQRSLQARLVDALGAAWVGCA